MGRTSLPPLLCIGLPGNFSGLPYSPSSPSISISSLFLLLQLPRSRKKRRYNTGSRVFFYFFSERQDVWNFVLFWTKYTAAVAACFFFSSSTTLGRQEYHFLIWFIWFSYILMIKRLGGKRCVSLSFVDCCSLFLFRRREYRCLGAATSINNHPG